jgi:hypothetical protein
MRCRRQGANITGQARHREEGRRLVYPMQSGVIAILLLIAIGVVFWRLAGRGPSRMSRALYTIAAVLLGVWLLSLVVTFVGGAAPG